jgi:hypothetical protein
VSQVRLRGYCAALISAQIINGLCGLLLLLVYRNKWLYRHRLRITPPATAMLRGNEFPIHAELYKDTKHIAPGQVR